MDSLASIQHAIDVNAAFEVGSRLPLTNAVSLDVAGALGASKVWLSPELTMQQIRHVADTSPLPLGIKVHGAQELMVTEHCMLMSQGDCNQQCATCVRRRHFHTLKDRKGYEFPVVTDCFGRSHIYNSVALDTVNALGELVSAGVTSFMIDATLMDPEQTAHATGRLKKALSVLEESGDAVAKLPDTTSGHLFRGVR